MKEQVYFFLFLCSIHVKVFRPVRTHARHHNVYIDIRGENERHTLSRATSGTMHSKLLTNKTKTNNYYQPHIDIHWRCCCASSHTNAVAHLVLPLKAFSGYMAYGNYGYPMHFPYPQSLLCRCSLTYIHVLRSSMTHR